MDSKSLLILGAGQYGHVARETAEAMGCFEKIAFLDDNNPLAIGKLSDYKCFTREFDSAFVAMGKPNLRMQWLDKLVHAGYKLPALLHPKAYVSPTAEIGEGVIVEPMAVVNTEAVIARGCLLCAGCVVNHNACVMTCCQIDCNAVVASNATVPVGTKVYSGTVFTKE